MNFFDIKNINKIAFAGFFLTIVFACLGFTAKSENLSSSVIRLHVKANSNSQIDQDIKLYVKDEISHLTEDLMQNAKTKEQANTILAENLEYIEQVANVQLADCGSSCSAVAELTKEYFPTRNYEQFTLPAGEYNSLKISIGKADGDNWWCVVYPSLCTSTAIDGKLTEEQEDLVTKTPQITFKFYELYLDMVNFLKGVDIGQNIR